MNTLIKSVVDSYPEWFEQRYLWQYHHTFFLTVKFAPLPGPAKAKQKQMEEEIQRLYAIILSRCYRRPRNILGFELPLWVGCPDLPIAKRKKSRIEDTQINGGLHYHCMVSQPSKTRLDCAFSDYIDLNKAMLIGTASKISHLHCTLVDFKDIRRACGYALKSITRRRADSDDILILPHAGSER